MRGQGGMERGRCRGERRMKDWKLETEGRIRGKNDRRIGKK